MSGRKQGGGRSPENLESGIVAIDFRPQQGAFPTVEEKHRDGRRIEVTSDRTVRLRLPYAGFNRLRPRAEQGRQTRTDQPILAGHLRAHVADQATFAEFSLSCGPRQVVKIAV